MPCRSLPSSSQLLRPVRRRKRAHLPSPEREHLKPPPRRERLLTSVSARAMLRSDSGPLFTTQASAVIGTAPGALPNCVPLMRETRFPRADVYVEVAVALHSRVSSYARS